MKLNRVARTNYTVLDNDVLSHGLSARAVGVFFIMWSKPPEWRFSSDRLAEEVAEGRDAVRTAMGELESAGYLRRVVIGGVGPRTEWWIRDSLDLPWPGESGAGESGAGQAVAGSTGALVSTERVSTEEVSTEQQRAHAVEAAFDDWWAAYPRKVSKPAAFRAFKAAYRKVGYDPLWQGLDRWVRYWSTRPGEDRFIPHPATWLNGERWNDPVPSTGPAPRQSVSSVLDEFFESARVRLDLEDDRVQ